MDKNEYITQKNKIIESFGQPEWDNKAPVNEAAIRLNRLMTDYRNYCRLEALRKVKNTENDLDVKDKKAKKEKGPIKSINLEGLEINETDLVAFTEVEKEVIRLKFENWTLKNKQISIKVTSFSTQQVTALLDSPAFKILQNKVFDKLLTLEVNLALLAAVRQGDSKVIQRLAEQKGILKPEKMEIDLNKPIEDTNAIKMLKELGDKLIKDDK